ncbi:MAG: hypothetical protein LBN18_05545 [Dysgonamonadaceae bacterium]|nr:hypothetical protein [Dysgonamonadaceae bacterium]
MMNTLIRKSTGIMIGVIVCMTIVSCGGPKPQLATVKAPVLNDMIVATNDLKAYLATHPKLSVVLRVPQGVQNVTSAQQEQNNFIYAELEKTLLMAGFDVKDRASVQNILQNTSDIFDYEQIGKKLKIDLFIEVTELSLAIPFYQPNYKVKATGSQYTTSSEALNTSYARFGYKIVIAETGSVGGMFTIHKQRCTEGCDFEVLFRTGMPTKYRLSEQRNSDIWYDRINWTFLNTQNEVAAYFANQLVNALKNK